MNVRDNIRKNIRYIRKKQEYTQQQFADSINVNRANVGAYEEGRAVIPIDSLAKISKEYNVSLDDLAFTDIELHNNQNSL